MARVPANGQAIRLAAVVALRQGASARAIQYLKPLTERAPDDAAALGLLGNAYMAAGKPDLALQQFTKVAAIQPDNPRAGISVAMAEIGTGKAKEGLTDLERVFDDGRGAALAGPALVLTALRLGDVDKAAKAAAKMAEAEPQNALYQTMLGVVRVRQGDNAGGVSAMRAALALQPDSGAAARNLAQALSANNQPDDAIRVYNDLLAKQPNDVSGLLGLAEIAVRQQKWDQAIDYLKRARAAKPDDPTPGIQLVNVYLLRGDSATAKATADQLAATFANTAEVIALQAQSQFAAGDRDAAINSYKRAYQLAPASGPILSRYVPLLLGAKKFAEARAVLQETVDRDPTNAGLRVDLIRITAEDGGLEAGIAKARSLASSDPNTPLYDIVVAELYEKAGRKDDAKTALERAAAGWPANPQTALALAAFYNRGGDVAKAQQVLKSRLKDTPDNATFRAALAALYLGGKNFAEAIAEYQQLEAQRPKDASFANNLAWAYQQQGDLAKAREAAERANTLAPKVGAIEDTLGWIVLAQGDTAQALTHLKAANAAAPRDPSIQYHLAVALGRSGNSVDARDLLEKLLSSGAVFPDKTDAEKLLEQLKRG